MAEQEQIVKRWRCGWCGWPATKEGKPLEKMELLNKDLHLWEGAELVPGDCCGDDIRNQEQHEHDMLTQLFGDT